MLKLFSCELFEGTAFTLLTNTGGHKHRLFRLGETFERFYFVPNTSEGEAQLQILCSVKARHQLRELLLSDLNNENATLPMEHDAIDHNGQPVLLAYEFDMERLRRFRNALELFGHSGLVYCFDFQREVLAEYFGRLARLQTISLEKVKNSGIIRCF